MKLAKFSTATLMTLVLATAAIADAGAAPTALSEGVYTAEQAASGKPMFEQNCSTCHNADYYKTVFQTWRGQPILYLFEQVMSAMPADKPGALLDNEYEDIFAYILQITGFPEGDARFEYASGMMRDIPVEPAS
jgi:mono/diheme cytochrome c family protein